MLLILKRTLIFSFCVFLIGNSYGQTLNFSEEPIPSVFEKIEANTHFTFNYNKEALDAYQYSGNLDINNLNSEIFRVLRITPYTFEKKGNTFLIINAATNKHDLCGIVKIEDHTTLPHAHVLYLKNYKGTTTNEDGEFQMSVEGVKNDQIKISFIGYESKYIMLQDWTDDHCLSITLSPDTQLFKDEIIIKDYLLKGISQGGDFSSTKVNLKAFTHGASKEHDVFKSVQLLPGIHSTDDSASNLHIRGATPDQNLIVWEGATLYDPGHMLGMISSINPFVVSQMEIYKGVFHPKYDNRVGGVVDISLEDGITPNFRSGIGTTFTEMHLFSHIPLLKNKMSLILAGRKTLNTFFRSPTLISYTNKIFQNNSIDSQQASNTQTEIEDKVDFGDINVKWLYQPNNRLSIKAAYFQSINDFKIDSEFSNFNIKEAVNFSSYAFSFSTQYDWDKSTTTFGINQSSYQNNSSFLIEPEFEEDNATATASTNSISDFSVHFSHTLEWSDASEFELGYVYDILDVGYSYKSFALLERDENQKNEVFGNFHNLHGSYSYHQQNIKLNAGAKVTYYKESNDFRISPRLSIEYLLSEKIKLRLNAGRFHQYISQVQDLGNTSPLSQIKIWTLNAPIDAEILTSNKLSTGLIYDNKGWLIDIESYFNLYNGLNGYDSSNEQNIFFSDFFDSRMIGIDFLVKKSWNKYQLWVNYSLSKNTYSFDDGTSFASNNDRPQMITLAQTLALGSWNLSTTFSFRTGLPYTEAAGIERQDNEFDPYPFYEIKYNELNALRLKDYSRLDFNISHPFTFYKNYRAILNFSLLNILNTTNIFSRNYEILYSSIDENELISFDKKLLGMTPQFLFRVSF